jgi:hypothetical protein
MREVLTSAQAKSATLSATVALVGLLAMATSAKNFSSWSAPVNLGPLINSAFDEMHPALSPDGRSLYFSSNRPGGTGGFDLWVSQWSDEIGGWGSPQNLGTTLNSAAGEFAPAFDPGGHVLFFGSERAGGCGGRDLWMSVRQHKQDDFGWGPPVNLGCALNSSTFDDGPAYFEEENGLATLYFISGRPGGLGERDVWASVRAADGTFGAPFNVTELNSPAADTRPAVSRDGLELFFTSQRAGSIEGTSGPSSDIWTSTRETTGATWSVPINLDPLNTSAAEAAPALSKDREVLYFNSNRPGGSGGLDLYRSTRSQITGRR